ncbi:Dihydrouridine synthase (Dus) [Theileria parva strain Muguga]|uniref:Dihydrouridine synthase (Dus) n=1 Tax=Theileria parva strain Muguga TaxID=333668 RepID=UPI001C620A1B|nr:Dihydrouridine synthase (Dus) [Theileria parva strain Muguga]EAN33272.2 Dihydrouridine synthase (Dus) [Theileria parva strain Muguga]
MQICFLIHIVLYTLLYHIVFNVFLIQKVNGIHQNKIYYPYFFLNPANSHFLTTKQQFKVREGFTNIHKTHLNTMRNGTVSHSKPSLQIAPMLDVTYLHFRQFMRLLTRKTQLWTEMFVASSLINASNESVSRWLKFEENEHPIVAQLGGNCPETLVEAGRILKKFGYDEINLNAGCPSPRVSGKGCFGASLMKEKELVRDIAHHMLRELEMPVTVKTRLGVDEFDSYEFVRDFVSTVSESGCDHFIIHSRKAWLKGINPKQNRTIPPLQYEKVYRLQRDFPHLKFTINGGFKTMESILEALNSENLDSNNNPHKLNGVMIGRLAYENPCLLSNVDKLIYGVENPDTCYTRRILLENYANYIDENQVDTANLNISLIVKPILGVFHGEQGNKIFRPDKSTTESLSNVYDYDDFIYHSGESRHSMFIHKVIDLMDKINPEALDKPLY